MCPENRSARIRRRIRRLYRARKLKAIEQSGLETRNQAPGRASLNRERREGTIYPPKISLLKCFLIGAIEKYYLDEDGESWQEPGRYPGQVCLP